MAAEAGDLRRGDGRTTADKVHDAADAGIKPRSRWEKFKDGVAAAWHVIVEIAKVVVLVLGVVALIIGGPLAWIVFAAALIVLADTIMKYVKGQATLLDVALAALACIPGTKGLTTLAELSAAFKAGGTIGATLHVLSAGKSAIVGLAKAIPELARSANLLRKGLVPGLRAFVSVLGKDGALATPTLRGSLKDALGAFKTSLDEGFHLVQEARGWQGSGAFPGRDTYAPMFHPSGTRMEVGFPGLSNYATDAGTAVVANHDASAVWEGVQVGPGDPLGRFPGYRGSMVELHFNTDMTTASGITRANGQYGAGGTMQHFFDIKGAVAHGDVSVLDHAGHPIHIPEGTSSDQVNSVISKALGGRGTITLNHPTHVNLGVTTQESIKSYGFDIPDSPFGTTTQLHQVLGQTGRLAGLAHDASEV